MKPWIRLTGLATVLGAVLIVGVLVASHLETGGSGEPTARDVPSFTSEQAVAVVKEWIVGGTNLEAVREVTAALVCAGYYEGRGRWDVRCRLPWIPAEEYFFAVSEASHEPKPETEATLTFVRLLRQWGQVPEP
jgi:hypothetical protein